jgi:RNA polymerase primary sigma factor
MYLREMGTVPLLTREGEVEIAKRIERGQIRVLKALSRSPIVIHELLAMGEDLKKGVRSIKEVVTFDEEEITDEILQNRLNEFTGKIDDHGQAVQKGPAVAGEVRSVSQKKRPKDHRRARRNLRARHRCGFESGAQAGLHQRRAQALIDRVNKTVDGMRSLDRQAQNLERKADATRSEEQKKEYRRQARAYAAN